MSCLISPLLRLVLAVFSDYEEDQIEDSGVTAIYVVVVFFAFGVWIMFKRYDTIRNRAVEFEWIEPEVGNFTMHFPYLINRLTRTPGRQSCLAIHSNSFPFPLVSYRRPRLTSTRPFS